MEIVALLFFIFWCSGIFNFGYIIAAKVFGYNISEFSIGFGPKLASFTIGNTRYILKPIILISHVSCSEDLKSNFSSLVFICCGPLAVLFLSLILTSAYLFIGYEAVVPGGAVVIETPTKGTAAKLIKGDVVSFVEGKHIDNATDLVQRLDNWKSGELKIVVLRGGQTHKVVLKRKIIKDGSRLERLGIIFGSLTEIKRYSFFNALVYSPYYIFKDSIGRIAWMFAFYTPQKVQNSIIFNAKSKAGLLFFFAHISFMFGILNLFPIPPLVGGEALNIVVQMFLGYSLSDTLKERFKQIGFMVLILFMCLVLYRDILQFFVSDSSVTYKSRSEILVSTVRWSQANVYWTA